MKAVGTQFSSSPSRAGDSLVKMSNVGINRDGRWLIRGVDLSVNRGEIVTLIGPNGSGKSTTAKAVIGVVRPDEGAISRVPGLTVGYVPQKLSIDWTLPLTVNRLMRLTADIPAQGVADALDSAGVGHLAGAQVRHLSGGEFQRVLLARAIARRPDLLVLDEPVQGVDFSGEVALYELISRLRDKWACGILLVSHDLHIVMAATDSVICLNTHVCCRGTPDSVARSAEYRTLFGGRADATLALYQHHHDHTHLADGRVRHADGTVTEDCHPEDGHHPGNENDGKPADGAEIGPDAQAGR